MSGRITQIDHLGIYVENLDAAVHFWRDVVGLECAGPQERREHGIRLAYVRIGDVELELIEAPIEKTQLRHMPHQGPGLYHVGLRTDDVTAAIDRLRAAGVAILDPVPREGQAMRIQFASPDGPSQGVMIEVVERRRPGPSDKEP